jgi:hypothetical protein
MCPKWAERYYRDQVVLSVPGRETIRRPRIDIEIESTYLIVLPIISKQRREPIGPIGK